MREAPLWPHLLIQPADVFGEVFALHLHVLHSDLLPGSIVPRRHAGLHHGDHVPQLFQHAQLTPEGRQVNQRQSGRTRGSVLERLVVFWRVLLHLHCWSCL